MTDSVKAHVALFSAQVIYALNYSIAKDLMPDYILPLALVLLRIGGAFILFWLISFLIPTEKLAKGDLKKMALLALFGVAINQGFFIYGLSLTKPINSAIIMISNPIVVMLFAILVLKDRITVNKIAGLLLGIAGALILLLFRGNFVLGSETLLGDVMTLINSVSWAIFVVMAKPYMQKYQTVTVMKWIFLFGLLYMFPFGVSDLCQFNYTEISPSVWFAIGFVVVATTFLAYLLNTYALKALSPGVVSMYIYFQPFLASFFAMLFGKDTLTPIKVLSALMIIGGVFLVSWQPSRSVKN